MNLATLTPAFRDELLDAINQFDYSTSPRKYERRLMAVNRRGAAAIQHVKEKADA